LCSPMVSGEHNNAEGEDAGGDDSGARSQRC